MANGQSTSGSSALQLAKQPNTGLSTQVSMSEWQVIREQAAMLVTTGFLPQAIKTPEQALAIILTGRELGIGPMAALRSIDVIQGKPSVSPQLMLALINRTGEVEKLSLKTSDQGATCTIKRQGQDAYTATFGPKEAAALNLNGKDNYKKQPATMYKWRAIADAARSTFPDAILGLYTPDEMGATVNTETGEVIDAPEPQRPAQTLPPIEGRRANTGAELVPFVEKVADYYEVMDHDEIFEVRKDNGAVVCSCGADGKDPCQHRLAVSLWAVEQKAKTAEAPPATVDAEPEPATTDEISDRDFSQPPPDEPKAITKSQLISLCELTKQLEDAGVDEDSWRSQMENLTGSRSRKGIMSDELAKVMFAFNNALAAQQRKGKRGAK